MKIKLIGMMLVITIMSLTGCTINIPVKTNTSETQDKNRNNTAPQEIPIENSNQNSSNSNQDSTPTNKPDEELEPHIKVGEVDSTEMDAAYVTSAQLIDIPESMKVDGTWSFHVDSIKSSSVDCDPDLHYCEAYFSIKKFSEGKPYTLTVEFEGQIDGAQAYLKETKSFVAPKPYSD
ncbi:hypothetical protein [Shimazuella kribbensis]|uniref:hypothetical protein n=1 Tax=Shimazuella kribbensis TaxID=139808 RepID=UPI0003FF4127|nr:hypothetical protein [Shimazuella kribbensis]